jgi:hypothetical protein
MKKLITTYLLKFALVATILTVIFRYFLSYGIDNRSIAIIVLSAVLYSAGMYFAGMYFGRKEHVYLPIYDVGFRFHLTTYLVCSLIWGLFHVLGFGGYGFFSGVIIWSFFLLIHFLVFLRARKKAINDLDKEDLFD